MKGIDNVKVGNCSYCKAEKVLKTVVIGRAIFYLCDCCRGEEVEDEK